MHKKYYFDWWTKYVWPAIFWLTTVSLYLACLHFRVGNWWFAVSAVLSALILRFAVKSVGEWVEILVPHYVSNGGHYVYYQGSSRQTRIVQAAEVEHVYLPIIWFGASFLLFWSLGGGH